MPYPARFDFSEANPWRLEALAAATGGGVVEAGADLFRSSAVWQTRPGWWLWTLVALVLFMIDLTIRHAPRLLGLSRRSGSGPVLSSARPARAGT